MSAGSSLAALASLAALLALPAGALAQPDADEARARALFERGIAAFDAGDLEAAEASFRASVALRTSTSVLFNLGIVLAEQGRVVEARTLFERVAREADTPEALRRDASERVRALQARVGRIRVLAEAPGVEFSVDEDRFDAAALGARLPVDPGPHRVTLRRGAAILGERTVTVAEGRTREVVFDGAAEPTRDGAPADGAPADGAPGAQPSASPSPGPFALAGVGAAALLGAAVTGALAAAARDEAREEFCGGGTACAPGYEGPLQEA